MVKHVLIGLVRVYQVVLSPWLGSNCRHDPTCSRYAIEALETWGAWKGTALTVRRVSSMSPLGHAGPRSRPPESQHRFLRTVVVNFPHEANAELHLQRIDHGSPLACGAPGCHSIEDSATMKEARALNEETTEVGRKFHQRLDLIREDLQAQLEGNPGGLVWPLKAH